MSPLLWVALILIMLTHTCAWVLLAFFGPSVVRAWHAWRRLRRAGFHVTIVPSVRLTGRMSGRMHHYDTLLEVTVQGTDVAAWGWRDGGKVGPFYGPEALDLDDRP